MKLLFKQICIAFCFISFGLFTIVGNLFFVPVAIFRLNKFKVIENLCRDIIFYTWRLFIWLIYCYGSVKVNFNVPKNVFDKGGSIIISNHPSLLDVVILISHIRRANCIVKAELSKNIFLFAAIRAANFILNTENEDMIEKSLRIVKNKENLIIFPEGTRTKDKVKMQKGAFYVAINSADKLQSLFIDMSPKEFLKKKQAWYDIPDTMVRYNINLLDVIELDEFETEKSNPVRVRLLYDRIQHMYEKENL